MNGKEEQIKCCNIRQGPQLASEKQANGNPHPVGASASCPYWLAQVELSLRCVCKPMADIISCTDALPENQIWQN